MTDSISRKRFIQNGTLVSAALLLSSLEGLAAETDDKKIRIAVIGCGSVSNRYLPHLKTSALIDIVSGIKQQLISSFKWPMV